MKILSIRLKNLASLAGEHFIDFEAEPLASAGLIAIVGKTGAGKSTILDAMCLALFNRIPRLKDSDGKLVDADGSELLTNSPLTVLRRGAAHGFAELRFAAQDQKHYTARWEVKRSREKADGKLQSVQRYLKCDSDGTVLADKAKAVDAGIHRITQLSFEQFTRAVLLAQSEVTAFLKARDNERGELLEYLTNSAIFGKIGQLAFEKTKSAASQRKEIESLLGHIELLSDEQASELRQQFQLADADCQKLETEKFQLQKQQRWFERKQKLDSEIAAKQQLVHAQTQAQEALIPERERLNRLEVFSAIRPSVFQRKQLLKTEQLLAPQLQKQQHEFEQAQRQFNAAQQQFSQAETALTELQNFEQIHRDALNQVRKCVQERDFIGTEFKKIQAQLQGLEQSKQPLIEQQLRLEQQIQRTLEQQSNLKQQLAVSQQFAALDHGLPAHIQQLTQFIQHYTAIEDQLGPITQAEARLAEYQVQLQQSAKLYGDIQQLEKCIETAQQQREQTLSQSSQLEFMQQNLNQYFELQTEYRRLQEKLSLAEAQAGPLLLQTQHSEQLFQNAKNERIKLEQMLQQQRLLHAENIEHLRAALQDGEACPVCGSTAHPYKTDHEALSKALFELQQQQAQQAVHTEQEQFKHWQDAQRSLTTLTAEIEQFKISIAAASNKVSAAETGLHTLLQRAQIQLNLTLPAAQVLEQFKQLTQAHQDTVQQLDTQAKQLAAQMKTQQQLHQNIGHTEHLLQSARQLQNQVQHIAQCLPEPQQQSWKLHSLQPAQQALADLSQRQQQLEQLEQLAKQTDQLQQELKTAMLNAEHCAAQILQTSKNLNDIQRKGQQNTETATSLIQQMTGINELKPNEWLQQQDERRLHIQQQYQQQKQNFSAVRSLFEQQRSALEQLQAQQQQNQQHAKRIEQDIQQWLVQHASFQQQDLAELAQISQAQEQHIRQQLQNADRLQNEANAALSTMREQLTEHYTQQPETDINQLQQLTAENAHALQQQQALRDQLKLKLELHQQNLAKQQQFAQQIAQVQQEEHRWGKISGLMGDAAGKKFRDYAQQYNLDILLEYANQQLAMLSQRYTLKRLENSLSLAIIDHDMDGETRSVASLSGGEAFLTALALSLAIANMASGSMKIESLFIDEGFGTLDASSLHMVMNALDQLQHQGRKVVLISHIQDMHERIPVQIQVRPVGAGASTIEVVC